MRGGFFGAGAVWASAQVAVQNAGAAVARWNDPRRRLLRQRRAARRSALKRGAATGVLMLGTVAMAAADLNVIVVAGGAAVTTVVALPAVAVTLRLRRLLRTPLPAERVQPVAPPARGSAARKPLDRLSTAEASLRELVDLLERDALVPPSEIHEVAEAAASASTVLRGQAERLIALERARDSSVHASAELGPLVRELGAGLSAGVGEYEQLVAGAARALAVTSVAPRFAGVVLTEAIDRVDALTTALSELAEAGAAATPRAPTDGG